MAKNCIYYRYNILLYAYKECLFNGPIPQYTDFLAKP